MLCEVEDVSVAGHAVSYEEGLEMINTVRPDAILLDINLPGRSGIDLLQKVKAGFNKIKVIMLTNYADTHYRNLCRQHGADFFLDKTTEFDQVEGILKSFIK